MAAKVFAELVSSVRAGFARGEEKRRYPRTLINVKAHVSLLDRSDKPGRTWIALTHDLSLCGIGLLQTTPVEADSRLLVTLERGCGTPIAIWCTVRHCRPVADGIFAVGAEFDTIIGQSTPDQPATRGTDSPAQLVGR